MTSLSRCYNTMYLNFHNIIPLCGRECKSCLQKVRESPKAIKDFIPENHKTYKLCLEAVKEWGCFHLKTGHGKHALCYIPEKHKNNELYLAAVRKDGRALEYIDKQYITYELCLEAVKQTGYAIQAAPEEYRTLEIMKIAAPVMLNYSCIDPNIFPIKDWELEWFKDLWNVEKRRQFIRERGKEVFDQLNPITISENQEYKLIQFKYIKDQEGFQHALLFRCPSSNDQYFIEVPQSITEVNEAVIFLNNGISKEELAFES